MRNTEKCKNSIVLIGLIGFAVRDIVKIFQAVKEYQKQGGGFPFVVYR